MDLSTAIVARSNQVNADDLVGGPQTVTVTEVRMGDAEQPVSIVLAEWGAERPFKPSKTVLRILVLAWGADSDQWPKGARMTIFRDATVKWAGQAVGGIRVSHLSHLKEGKQLKVALAESKGKKVLYTVEPLADAPAAPDITDDLERVKSAGSTEDLSALWATLRQEHGTIPERLVAAMTERAAALKETSDAAEDGDELPLDGAA